MMKTKHYSVFHQARPVDERHNKQWLTEEIRCGNMRIVIVEDETLIRENVRNILRGLEYYNQGIKLEEIAHNLNVSEEYLST